MELKTFIRDRYRDAQQKFRASQPPISELPPPQRQPVAADERVQRAYLGGFEQIVEEEAGAEQAN